MNSDSPTVPRWKVPFTAFACLCAGLMAAPLVERLLVPDPCKYHSGEYLGGEVLPWWINTFFTLDEMGHPEAGLLFYGTVGLLCAVGLFLIFVKMSKNRYGL